MEAITFRYWSGFSVRTFDELFAQLVAGTRRPALRITRLTRLELGFGLFLACLIRHCTNPFLPACEVAALGDSFVLRTHPLHVVRQLVAILESSNCLALCLD
jgi:hypothetical protein